jgi:hypothetical protein
MKGRAMTSNTVVERIYNYSTSPINLITTSLPDYCINTSSLRLFFAFYILFLP